ncbi:MAG: hypothetical protein AAF215_27175 [Cyanobacteria bacterium P01_A01_bin.123]
MPTALQAIRYISLLPDVQRSQATEKGLTVLALAMVEGTFTDALGKEYTYDEEWLNAIAIASNTLLAQGREIPFFHSEHDFEPNGYANRNKVGLVRGQFIVQRITPELLPKPEMVEIAGKLGLFTQIEILRPDAIALYQQGLLKAISIGITLADDDYWIKNAVFEISAVAWGAVPQAMLFGRYPTTPYAKGTLPAEQANEPMGTPKSLNALTLEGAIAAQSALMEDMSGVDNLLWAFMETLRSIKSAPAGELLGRDRGELTRSAIADLTTRLQEALGVARSSPPSVPVFSREVPEMPTDPSATPTTEIFDPADAGGDAIAALTERIAALEAKEQQQAATIEQQTTTINALKTQNEQQTREAAIASQWSTLKDQAIRLNRAGQLPKAALSKFFPEGENQQQAVAKFARSPQEGEAPQIALETIKAQLDFVEQFGQKVQFGAIATGNDPISNNPNGEALPPNHEDDMARFNARRKAHGLQEVK